MQLPVEQFVAQLDGAVIFDVRTPAEYDRGHIPGAVNLPLFSDEERKVIGTLYRMQGRDNAVLKGLEFVGPKMRALVESVRQQADGRRVMVHCWRGGMRSNSLAWLLQTSGIDTTVLVGGYKAFRNYVLKTLDKPRNIVILSGATGTGKTAMLRELQIRGEQVIDLEDLANHKGSSFGALGEDPQPTQQQFENDLALQWQALDAHRPLWLEDESRYVGTCLIPEGVWSQMRSAPVIFVDMPAELRTQRLLDDYGQFETTGLQDAITRLEKRLGGVHTRSALDLLNSGALAECTKLLLEQYYDKLYLHGLTRRDSGNVHRLPTDTTDAAENARKAAALARQLFPGLFSRNAQIFTS